MGFLAICTVIYDYAAQAEEELELKEGDLVYILEKPEDDDWWKAKKKAENEDEDEPIGLVPNNYVEDARPSHHAKAMYDYSRQTDEELSFEENDRLEVYDTADPDWTLVGHKGEFGFAPSNYIEIVETVEQEDGEEAEAEPEVASPKLPPRPPAAPQEEEEEERDAGPPSAAANLAAVMAGRAAMAKPPPMPQREPTPEPEEEEEPAPRLPARPMSQTQEPSPPIQSPPLRSPSPQSPEPSGVMASPPGPRHSRSQSEAYQAAPGAGGFHLYHVNEMVSVMGKQKKMPMTLGINLATGTILIFPEKKRDGPQQEWTAEKLTHYSIEGKHVFLELVKPSKSIDFHAGAKDTAMEIVASLGELAGGARAEGLREVIAAGAAGGPRRGRMLYDFMAQGDDEVTVADGDEVVILDSGNEEWWKVRRVKNGKEGVVPSSYVEAEAAIPSPPPQPQEHRSRSSNAAGGGAPLQSGYDQSAVERNRREEERLTREAIERSEREAKRREQEELKRSAEVGPGLKLPNRQSSLDTSKSQRRGDGKGQPKTKPDPTKVRTWTDRSGTFKVDAQFIGLKDSKIHLHKVNGVKIAVPVSKMATSDLEYVERATGASLDDDKPLDAIRRRSQAAETNGSRKGPQENKPEYDWFDFFLKCGVSPYQCERYSYNFNKDSMDESILSEITPATLRTLGLKEGDILRVMKYLDNKFSRTGSAAKSKAVRIGGEEVIAENGEDGEQSGGLFTGPGGALRNNTRKGRPAPAVQTSDIVNAEALRGGRSGQQPTPPPSDSPDEPGPRPPPKDRAGFEDNAWDVKPSAKRQTSAAATKPASPPPPKLSGNMAALSLLDEPLQPTVANPQSSPPPQQTTSPPPQLQAQQTATPQNPQPPQQQGANPQFFNQLSNQQQQPQIMPPQQTAQRQRPAPPPVNQQAGGILPPPPTRPLSAPQNQSSYAPPQLQPQLTGAPSPYQQQQQQQAPPMPALPYQQPLQPQLTSFQPQSQFGQLAQAQQQLQPQGTGFPAQGQGLAPQMTGYQQPGMAEQYGPGGLMPQATGINSVLPPAMVPQSTGINGFGQQQQQQAAPPVPGIPTQFGGSGVAPQQQQQQTSLAPTPAPLQPQKTGPAPPVRFGVGPEAKKLAVQPTGRRANLAAATPENPFGF